MAHIKLPEGQPGIIGPLMAYRDTEVHLDGLANTLMVGDRSLTKAERELIATYVSYGNKCYFCTNSHAAVARNLLAEQRGLVDELLRGLDTAAVDDKLRALLVIADKVRRDGRLVSEEDVAAARAGRRRRPGDSRHRLDRRHVLHVQSVCGRPGNADSQGPQGL